MYLDLPKAAPAANLQSGWCKLLRTPLDILNLFVSPPGDLLFFLLVIAFSQGALFLAFGNRSRFPFEHITRRFVFAASSLVVIWLAMLGAAFLGQYAELDPARFMPPLERLAFSVSLLILSWAFLSADFIRWRNRSNIILFGLTLLLVLQYINTARGWINDFGDSAAFNATSFASVWAGLTVAIAAAALSLALLNYRQSIDAPLKVVFFAVFIAGNGWDLYRLLQDGAAGNFLGGARLAYLSGLILLPLIIYRLSIALLENSLVEVVLAASQQVSALAPPADATDSRPNRSAQILPSPPNWQVADEPVSQDRRRLLYALGKMLEPRADARIPDQIVKAVIETLDVEICLLLRVEDNNYAEIIAGYDQVAERSLSGISLNLAEQPTLLEASRRGEGTILFPDYHRAELDDLFRRLTISPPSSVYAQPLTVDGELVAALLVSLPYQQAQLPPAEQETLEELSFVAASILAWNAASSAAKDRSDALESEKNAAGSAAAAEDFASIAASRKALLSNLEHLRERNAGVESMNAKLRQQLADLQGRFMEAAADNDDAKAATPKLSRAFEKLAQLRESCQACARDHLDAETVLRVLGSGDGDSLQQILREFLHKEHNLLLISRDRLRRAVNAIVPRGRSPGEGIAGILQALSDEAGQLGSELDQHETRRKSVVAKLESLGATGDYSNLVQVLTLLYAERDVFAQGLAAVKRERLLLLSERQELLESGRGADEELARKLKHLSADHEQLLNAREEMRREKLELEAEVKSVEAKHEETSKQNEQLQAELASQIEAGIESKRQVGEWVEERDNLLAIRDQLKARVSTLMEDEAKQPDTNLEAKLAELQATVERLTNQREQLALELSDARRVTDSAAEAQSAPGLSSADDANDARIESSAPFMEMLQELRAPVTSIADYTDLLLAESIGIVGAAQMQVLQLIAADIDQLIAGISALHDVARVESKATKPARESTDLSQVIEDVVRETAQAIAEKGLLIELSLDEQLPPVAADGGSLKHILGQLLRNAREVSPTGASITLVAQVGRVQMAPESEAVKGIEILVRDAGGGIAADDLERVFARKYRAQNPALAGLSETGVGLTVSRAFARANNGDLWVSSEPGVGSTFHLGLPLQLAPSTED